MSTDNSNEGDKKTVTLEPGKGEKGLIFKSEEEDVKSSTEIGQEPVTKKAPPPVIDPEIISGEKIVEEIKDGPMPSGEDSRLETDCEEILPEQSGLKNAELIKALGLKKPNTDGPVHRKLPTMDETAPDKRLETDCVHSPLEPTKAEEDMDSTKAAKVVPPAPAYPDETKLKSEPEKTRGGVWGIFIGIVIFLMLIGGLIHHFERAQTSRSIPKHGEARNNDPAKVKVAKERKAPKKQVIPTTASCPKSKNCPKAKDCAKCDHSVAVAAALKKAESKCADAIASAQGKGKKLADESCSKKLVALKAAQAKQLAAVKKANSSAIVTKKVIKRQRPRRQRKKDFLIVTSYDGEGKILSARKHYHNGEE